MSKTIAMILLHKISLIGIIVNLYESHVKLKKYILDSVIDRFSDKLSDISLTKSADKMAN